MKKIVKFSILLIVIFFTNCKKENNIITQNQEPTYNQKRSLLTTGYWFLTKVNGNIFTQECSKDDKLLFYNDGKIIYDHGLIKCNLEPDQYIGTFVLDSTNTAYIARVLYLPQIGSTPAETYIDTLDVIKLDSSNLELQFRNQQKTLNTYQKMY